MATTVETARDRRRMVEQAGRPTVSFLSILAGTLVAFGTIALAMAAAGAVGSQVGLTTEGISTDEWRQAGIAGAVAAAVLLFVAFLFGGYTAGRMSRRAGTSHGAGVFVLAVVVIAAGAALAAWLGDPDSVRTSIDEAGVPTSASTWSDIGLGAGIAAVVAMLHGSLAGGALGDRWHTRLSESVVEREVHRRREEEPDYRVGEDPTTVAYDDHHDEDQPVTGGELSVEEERERARTEK